MDVVVIGVWRRSSWLRISWLTTAFLSRWVYRRWECVWFKNRCFCVLFVIGIERVERVVDGYCDGGNGLVVWVSWYSSVTLFVVLELSAQWPWWLFLINIDLSVWLYWIRPKYANRSIYRPFHYLPTSLITIIASLSRWYCFSTHNPSLSSIQIWYIIRPHGSTHRFVEGWWSGGRCQ